MKELMSFLAKYFANDAKQNILASSPDQDFIPYSIHYDDKTILTKNGELMQFIRVVGFSNNSVYADLVSLREAVRDGIRDNIKQNNFALWFNTIRRKKNISPNGVFNDVFSAKINQIWEEENNLQNDYINELYITVIIEGLDTSISNFKSFIRSFSKISTLKLHQDFLAQSCEELSKATQGILSSIADYGARILDIKEWEGVIYSEPMRFLGKVCNLEAKHYPLSANDISEDLFFKKIAFSNRQIEIVSGKDKYFGAILSLKEYIEIGIESLDKIMQLPFEFIITQSFDFSYEEEDLSFLKYQDNLLRVSKSEDFRDMMGLTNFFESVDGTATDYGKLQTTLMIICKSAEELSIDVELISEKFQALGLVVVREDVFLEDCFWAQLPANFKFLKRQKLINSYRIAGFSSLYSFPSGVLDGNYWGPAVTTLKTIENNPYFFNFHDNDNGHSLFIGGGSSGKTTLINFLLAQSRRYNNKIYYFDFDNKARNFLELLGGFYYDLSFKEQDSKYCLRINPLTVNINNNQHKFLTEFFYCLIYHSSGDIKPQEMQLIGGCVDKIITNKIYNLKEAINIFNNPETKNIFEILKYWNEPHLQEIFNHSKEINWADRIMGFDFSEYKDKSLIMTPILYYLLYRIENSLDEKSPSIVVFKDANLMLNNEIFIDKIVNLLDRFRQKNSIIIFCFNGDIKNDDNKLLALIAQKVNSRFVLENSSVDEELAEILNLNNEELKITQNLEKNNRKFLLKCGDDSLIISFDLSKHKALLRLLSSSPEDIAIIEEIFNHAKEQEKIIDSKIAIDQFYEIVAALELEKEEQIKELERQNKIAKMRKLRELD